MAKDEKRPGGRPDRSAHPEQGTVSYKRPSELTDAGTVDTPIEPVDLALHGNAQSHWQDEMSKDKERSAKATAKNRQQEQDGDLDDGLKDTFPASDPLASESKLTPGSPRKR